MQVKHYLQRVNFTTPNGENVNFNPNGDPMARYELVNWQKGENGETKFITVGYYDASMPVGKQFVMNNASIVWAGESSVVSLKLLCSSLLWAN